MLRLPSVQELVDLIIQCDDQEAGDAELVDLLHPAASSVFGTECSGDEAQFYGMQAYSECNVMHCGCCVVLLKGEI